MKIIISPICGDTVVNGIPKHIQSPVDALTHMGYHAGDSIWGVMFQLSTNKKRILNRCTPVSGVLSWTNDSDYSISEYTDPNYFIPYGKNGKLCYSKAVRTYSRCYATTEHDAKELYEELVNRVVTELTETINKAIDLRDKIVIKELHTTM